MVIKKKVQEINRRPFRNEFMVFVEGQTTSPLNTREKEVALFEDKFKELTAAISEETRGRVTVTLAERV